VVGLWVVRWWGGVDMGRWGGAVVVGRRDVGGRWRAVVDLVDPGGLQNT
jgi:hypothetical protein